MFLHTAYSILLLFDLYLTLQNYNARLWEIVESPHGYLFGRVVCLSTKFSATTLKISLE